MSKHTPGPWHRNVASISAKMPNKTTVIICRCTPEPGLPERDANARLIAAAPELLSACKMISRGPHDAEAIADMLPSVRAAIAKAEGGAA